MTAITKVDNHSEKLAWISRHLASKMVEVFPLAKFSETVDSALHEDGDDRATQNIFYVFQLQELRCLYYLLKQKIPGLDLMIPLLFSQREDETSEILWVGDSDPYDLCNSITVHAKTTWNSGEKGHSATTITCEYETPAITGCNCGVYLKHLTIIRKTVPPQIIDEAIRNFFRLLGVYIPCPKFEYAKDRDKHGKDCDLCHGEMRVEQSRAFGEKFRPSLWLADTLTPYW